MNVFGELIHACTREQALADGALIDVSQAAKEAGFRLPMAVTASVWADAVAWDGSVEEEYQDESGRLWDLLFMAHHAAVRAREGRTGSRSPGCASPVAGAKRRRSPPSSTSGRATAGNPS